MFTRPADVPLLVGIWFVPLLLGILVDPLGWPFFLPTPVAAVLRFSEARYFDRDRGCASEAPAEWRTIAASPDGAGWFRVLAREAKYPAGRLYGLVGLYALDRGAFEREGLGMARIGTPEGVDVFTDRRIRLVPTAELLRPTTLDSMVRELRDSTPKPYC